MKSDERKHATPKSPRTSFRLRRELASTLARQFDNKGVRPPGFITAWLPAASVVVQEVVPAIPIENRRVWVKFRVRNNRDEPVAGTVTAKLTTSAGTPTGTKLSSWRFDEVRGHEDRFGVITFVAPSAAVGYVLELAFHDGSGKIGHDVVDEYSLALDVAARYRFVVDSFHVNSTRAVETDTVSAFCGTNVAYPGDVRAGDTVQLALASYDMKDVVPNSDAATPFGFSLINNGDLHSFQEAYDFAGGLSSLVDPISGIINLAGRGDEGPDGNVPANPDNLEQGISINPIWVLAYWAFGQMWALNCNGVTVWDIPVVTGAALEQATASGDRWSQTETYPGTDSPVGCGGNSNYAVTYSYVRIREPGAEAAIQPPLLPADEVMIDPWIARLRAGEVLALNTPASRVTFVASNGHLEELPIKWQIDGPGSIDRQGRYTAPADTGGSDAVVKVQVAPDIPRGWYEQSTPVTVGFIVIDRLA